MIPIFLHDALGSRGYKFDEFEARVIEICEEHQRDRRACAFAFILHDAQSPHISKVRNDQQYFAALDSISGKSLTVFSVFAGALRRAEGAPLDEFSENMREIKKRSERTIEAYFNVNELRFPAVLFFQVNEGRVIASRLVKLQCKDIEAAYQELSDLLKLAAEAVQDSIGKFVRDPEEAFERIDRVLTTRSVFRMMIWSCSA